MTGAIPILLYHSVQDSPPPGFAPWAMNTSQFAEHLDTILRLDRVALNIAQLTSMLRVGHPVPHNAVVITFDDGLEDFARNAWPQLKSRALPATLYVTAGLLGQRSKWLNSSGAGHLPMLNTAQLCALVAQGVDIGAHSMTHPQLDILDREQAREQITGSKKKLEQVLGFAVDSFAYPHGYYNRAVQQMVIDAGYSSAAAVHNALSHAEDDRFALARYTVMADCTAQRLSDVIQGHSLPQAKTGLRLRSSAWRVARKARARLDGVR